MFSRRKCIHLINFSRAFELYSIFHVEISIEFITKYFTPLHNNLLLRSYFFKTQWTCSICMIRKILEKTVIPGFKGYIDCLLIYSCIYETTNNVSYCCQFLQLANLWSGGGGDFPFQQNRISNIYIWGIVFSQIVYRKFLWKYVHIPSCIAWTVWKSDLLK